MIEKIYLSLFFLNLLSQARNFPLHEVENLRPGFVGRGIVTRLQAFQARQMEAFELQQRARQLEPRLPLSNSQELEVIKKVVQLLAMIGDQVIPGIIGGNPVHQPMSASAQPHTVTDAPSDPVEFN